MTDEGNNQRILDAEHCVRVEIPVSLDEDMRYHCLITGSRHDRMDMRWPIRMSAHLKQHLANRTIGRNWILGRSDRPEPESALGVGVELAA